MDTKAGRHGIKFLQITLLPPVWRDLKVLVSGLAPPIGNHFGAIHLPLCTSTGARGRDEEWVPIALFKWTSSGKGGVPCEKDTFSVHTQYTQFSPSSREARPQRIITIYTYTLTHFDTPAYLMQTHSFPSVRHLN